MHMVSQRDHSLECNLKELRHALTWGKYQTLTDISVRGLFVSHKCHASLYIVMKSYIALPLRTELENLK